MTGINTALWTNRLHLWRDSGRDHACYNFLAWSTIKGVEFTEAWPDRVETKFAGVPAFVISRHDLIRNKNTSARLQDLADVQQLEATQDHP